MPEFLSSEYFEQAATTLRKHEGFSDAAAGVTLGVQFVVTEAPQGEIRYALHLVRGELDIVEGQLDNPDLTVTNDYATAVGISSGEINTQTAFVSGKLRVDGDMAALIRHQALIQQFSTAMSRMEVTF